MLYYIKTSVIKYLVYKYIACFLFSIYGKNTIINTIKFHILISKDITHSYV